MHEQKHNHSKTCRKYKNNPCRFHFGQFFHKEDICSIYYSEELDEESKMTILTKRNVILNLVREQIDKEATVWS